MKSTKIFQKMKTMMKTTMMIELPCKIKLCQQ